MLHHSRLGQGVPLIILHGLFGSGRNWQSLARGFAEGLQVICVDLRNHGRSFHADEMTYSVMTADVISLMDHLGIPAANILGHSMGGKVAMMLAATCPQRVKRLIVADIAPVTYRHDYEELITPILSLPLDTLKSREQADQIIAQSIQEAPLRAFLLQNLVRDANTWRWRVNWHAIQRHLDQLVGFPQLAIDWKIDHPSLFIRGALSDYVGDAEIDVINQHFSVCRIESLEQAGHWLHADQPREFSRHVLDFLAALD